MGCITSCETNYMFQIYKILLTWINTMNKHAAPSNTNNNNNNFSLTTDRTNIKHTVIFSTAKKCSIMFSNTSLQ